MNNEAGNIIGSIGNVIDLDKEILNRDLLTIYHDCHRCNTSKCIPQNIKTEKDVLEKECPKCGKLVCIW